MNVLLVEPDKILGEVAALALQRSGHTVLTRSSAQTALDALDERLPDVIVLEIQLGLHNGIELLYEIRSYHEWHNIPVVIHTINSRVLDDQFTPALAGLNVKSVLYKPRTKGSDLVRVVEDVVSKA